MAAKQEIAAFSDMYNRCAPKSTRDPHSKPVSLSACTKFSTFQRTAQCEMAMVVNFFSSIFRWERLSLILFCRESILYFMESNMNFCQNAKAML